MNPTVRTTSLIATLLLTLLLALPSAALADDDRPEIRFSNNEVRTGRQIGFTGRHFSSSSRVSIWATDPDGVAIKGQYPRADNDGELEDAKFNVPNGATPGTWTLTAKDLGTNRQVDATFRVIRDGNAQSSRLLSANPSSGSKSREFTFKAQNVFDPGEEVKYWIIKKDDIANGKKLYENNAYADEDDGSVTIRLTPSNADPGKWVFFIQTKRDNREENAKALAMQFEID